MKTRLGFVSNSSSCSFLITNKTTRTLSLEDFARETLYLVLDFNDRYSEDVSLDEFMKSIRADSGNIAPGATTLIFGDEDGTIHGRVYDYMLRERGQSKSFKWVLCEMLR